MFSKRAQRQRRRWPRVLVAIGIVVGVMCALGAVLWFTVLPSAIANLTATVAERDTTVTLVADDGQRASVVAPTGWIISEPPFSDDTVTLTSPDGVLQVDVHARDEGVSDAFAEAALAVEVTESSVKETLASGLDIEHATQVISDMAEKSDVDAEAVADDDVVVAAVGAAQGGGSVVVTARTVTGKLDSYRPAIAGLVESVRVPA